MWVNRVSPDLLSHRVDCEYYDPGVYRNLEKLNSWRAVPISNFIVDIRSEPPIHTDHYAENGIHIISPANFSDFFLDLSNTKKLAAHFREHFRPFILEPGRLLFSLVGDVGHACVVPNPAPDAISYRRTANLKLENIDSHFVCAYLNTPVGACQLTRLTTGVIQDQVRLEDSAAVLLPTVDVNAQSYIGNKIRIAERLQSQSHWLSGYAIKAVDLFMADRAAANDLEIATSELPKWIPLPLVSNYVRPVTAQSTLQMHTRVSYLEITQRLDCSFYSPRAMEVDRVLRNERESSPLRQLVDPTRQITNGVRGPELQASPFKLVRLQDREGWSINFDKCLSISERQYEENKRCKLRESDVVVAIGGYIGRAAIVRRVRDAVIGQHSAVLPLGAERVVDEGFLVAYLSSSDGSTHLQRYVSGTVQAGVNLEDLQDVRIPTPSKECQRHIGDAVRRADDYAYLSSRLCLSGRMLVELLLDRRLNEAELASAQSLLESDDQTADRAILGRLYEGGIDATDTRPLFPDLDAYYEMLQMAEQALADGGDE